MSKQRDEVKVISEDEWIALAHAISCFRMVKVEGLGGEFKAVVASSTNQFIEEYIYINAADVKGEEK